MLAELSRDLNGLEVIAKVAPITRGYKATLRYSIEVWSIRDGFRTMLRDGPAMLPPDFVQALKLELWERLKP
jgi:hypothetical protein